MPSPDKSIKEFEIFVEALVPEANNAIDMNIKFIDSLAILTSDLKRKKRGKLTIKVLPYYKGECNKKKDLDLFLHTSFSYGSMRKFLFKGIDINEKNVNKKVHDLAEAVANNKILDKIEKEKYLQLD